MLYLHSQNHQDTPRFCSEVLCTERVSTFLEDNFILWGGDVSTTPAFKLCNKYGTTNFPFIAVVANVTYNPSMVAFWHSMNYHPRITRSGEHLLYKKQGFVSEQDLINSLGEILELHQPLLHAARSERESRERDRILRDTQDEEYNRSVQEDLEKEQRRLREIEEERAREEEKIKEELMKEKEREREKEAKLQELLLQEERSQQVTEKKVEEKPNQSLPAPPPEPPKSSTTTDIKFRLSDGSTVIRRFSISELVSDLFLFVATKESIDNKVLTTSFPRKTYKFEQSPLTLQEAGLVPQALLVVEEPLF
uniref:UBX domain-containing protein n=1 Tax=Arcella intermedia TaxID=1963864 RepID=A0A6B2L9J2_9EUKA